MAKQLFGEWYFKSKMIIFEIVIYDTVYGGGRETARRHTVRERDKVEWRNKDGGGEGIRLTGSKKEEYHATSPNLLYFKNLKWFVDIDN